NEFDEEDGWPDLSCSLHTFKTTLIAWNAFLQLPKSIHSVVETVIEE
ncbi:TPA: protein MafI, partial [Neisseria meningitidis]